MCRRLFIYLFIVLLSCFVLEEFLGTVICESGECRTGQREDLSCDLVQETPPLISQELSSLGSLRVALSAARGLRTSSFRLAYFTCFYDQSNLRERESSCFGSQCEGTVHGPGDVQEAPATESEDCLISPSLCSVQDGSTQHGASQIGSSQLMSR